MRPPSASHRRIACPGPSGTRSDTRRRGCAPSIQPSAEHRPRTVVAGARRGAECPLRPAARPRPRPVRREWPRRLRARREIGLAARVRGSPARVQSGARRLPGTSSRIGSYGGQNRLLSRITSLGGSVYLAKPFPNSFGSLLAIYATVEDPATGTIREARRSWSNPDPRPIGFVTTFDDLPQLPFEVARLELDGGPSCRLAHAADLRPRPSTETDLIPWSSPAHLDATPSDSFAGQLGCRRFALPIERRRPAESAELPGPRPRTPRRAPTRRSTSSSGRADGSQELARVDLTLPKGLLGKLAGLSLTAPMRRSPPPVVPPKDASDLPSPAARPRASARSPSSAGPGPDPFHTNGTAYLAGPYKGAPMSAWP